MKVGRHLAEVLGGIPGMSGYVSAAQLWLRRRRGRIRKGLGHPTIPAKWLPHGTTMPHVILVGHEATRSGAPAVLLRLAKHLRSTAGIGCRIVLLADGPLRSDFAAVAPTIVVPNVADVWSGLADAIRHCGAPCVVVCNTIATAPVADQCRLHGVPVISWIHETSTVIDEFFGGQKTVRMMCKASRRIVCPSKMVADSLMEAYGVAPRLISIVPYGVDETPATLDRRRERARVREELGIPADARLVLACGRAEQRKGIDLFIQLAGRLAERSRPDEEPVHFVWVGRWEEQSKPWARHDVRQLGLEHCVHFPGEQSDPGRYFAAADVFVMPSREESCGMVALEAASCGCPVVSFRSAVGAAEMLTESEAIFVTYLNVDAMADAVQSRLDNAVRPASDVAAPSIASRFPWSRCLGEVRRIIEGVLDGGQGDGLKKAEGAPLIRVGDNRTRETSILLISYGPPPVPGVATVEGTGLRSWGLAKALAEAMPRSRVTLVIPDWHQLPSLPDVYEGVRIGRWSVATLSAIISEHDVIVASYCLGDDSIRIVDAVFEHQLLVWDAYVPIHVEVCARRSIDRYGELAAYERDRVIWERALKRGDLFLCATQSQKLYYMGVLAAIGRINPVTYDDDPLLIVPYGVHEDEHVPGSQPCSSLIADPSAWKLLWFGGVYPWFDIGCLLEAVKLLAATHPVSLIIVGAKNPFVRNADFDACVERMMQMVEAPAIRPLVHLVDWVSFHERGDWYLDADLICFANQPGAENLLAWRTRLVDYLWTRTPMATNGGDPLSEELINSGAAVRIDATDPVRLAQTLAETLGNPGKLSTMREAAGTIREKYLWRNAIRPLAKAICTRPLS